jgi:hypothetical protein
MAKKSETLDSPRVRFNWGFHDAQHDAERGMPRARGRGREYAAGYTHGFAAWDVWPVRIETSEPAWQLYQSDKLAAQRAAKRLKNARPDDTKP